MSWFHANAPDRVFEKHLRHDHGKSSSWVDEHRDDLRSAHNSEHQSGRADHDLDADLEN